MKKTIINFPNHILNVILLVLPITFTIVTVNLKQSTHLTMYILKIFKQRNTKTFYVRQNKTKPLRLTKLNVLFVCIK